MIDDIHYIVNETGNGSIFCKFYVKVSKLDYHLVVREQFWASLEGFEGVTFVTEKELNNSILGKIEKGPKKQQ